MSAFLQGLGDLHLLHTIIIILEYALILCFIVQFLLSWILQGRDNKITRFFRNVTGPMTDPLDRILPPISLGGISFRIGFIVAWWSVTIAALLVLQALPANW